MDLTLFKYRCYKECLLLICCLAYVVMIICNLMVFPKKNFLKT